MNANERQRLTKEVQLQSRALKKIGQWRTMAMAVSTIGAALVYAGFIGGHNLVFGIFGIALLPAGIGCAAILNLGLKNGRNNMEKIMYVLDGEQVDGV